MKRKRLWTIADLAQHMGIPPRRARAFVRRLNEKHGGKIVRYEGCGYVIDRARLRRAMPDLFLEPNSLEMRVERIEEGIEEIKRLNAMIEAQLRMNIADVAKIRRNQTR